MTPAEVLTGLLRSDPTSPRITCYDDGTGERIELSGKVLANWVSKAANLLQDELDAGPGTTVALHLPADHWRTYYWALAAWSVGAHLTTTDAPSDIAVGITADGSGETEIVVTLAALARRATSDVPAGGIDEARELSSYGDVFVPYRTPVDADPALDDTLYADLVVVGGALRRRVQVTGDLTHALREALAVWADDGSVVLLRDVRPEDVDRRLTTEGAAPRP
ncbi:TIGR03089 family protein [Allobranchiibius sp. CTAmp26]|uniref:TIGR03089 family protein n=1 Tax=Allobranchiibius sp. CTAmp26 TaxID=2815214 RepID=UPI001AA1B554|nr:TIGR03089 family protein [Allobranchiibius sp. CTAmp26]MBO1755637.1 TIGR03089 family protein [Allobranchiibius sp. CTAmp26]